MQEVHEGIGMDVAGVDDAEFSMEELAELNQFAAEVSTTQDNSATKVVFSYHY